MKLTKYHREILQHRLDVPDCISESLDISDDDNTITDACRSIEKKINSMTELDKSVFNELETDIIINCLECGTFFASMDDRVEHKEITRYASNKFYDAVRELGIEFECDWMTS
jgi:hypothetical protein